MLVAIATSTFWKMYVDGGDGETSGGLAAWANGYAELGGGEEGGDDLVDDVVEVDPDEEEEKGIPAPSIPISSGSSSDAGASTPAQMDSNEGTLNRGEFDILVGEYQAGGGDTGLRQRRGADTNTSASYPSS